MNSAYKEGIGTMDYSEVAVFKKEGTLSKEGALDNRQHNPELDQRQRVRITTP